MMELDPRLYENVSISDNDVRNIVLSYLMHNCFKETAETFLSSTGLKLPVDYTVDVDKRKAMFNFVLEGNALKAIELTEEVAPNLLENDMDLHFDLLSLHFIELVRSRKCTEALEFGQKKITSFGKVPKYVEKLELQEPKAPERLGEDVSELPAGLDELDDEMSSINAVPEKVELHVDVLAPVVEHRILCQRDCRLVIHLEPGVRASTPVSSTNNRRSQTTWHAVVAAATYSASHVESATVFCFNDCQAMGAASRNTSTPDFMALLAYEEPEKSPMFHLLSPEHRQNVADSLNRAVLAHANLPAYSSLERVVQQATVVRQYLQQEVGKDSYPPFSLKAFLSK